MTKILNLLDIVEDKSGGNKKIPQSEYLINGDIPVIDQGKDFIAGYTNQKKYLLSSVELPVVIFGDHTRVVKYIDFPFAIGADGVKVLKPKEGLDTKYFYYFLKCIPITDAGYSRHFKFLKEKMIPVPSLEKQRRIAAMLDKVDEICKKRQQAIALLDELLQATFIDMFGDPIENEKGWDIGIIGEMFESVKYGSSNKGELEGEVPILRMNNITYSGEMKLRDLKYINKDQADEKYLVRPGDILFNLTNSKELIGKTAVYYGPEPMAYTKYLMRGRTLPKYIPEYISGFLNSSWGKSILQSMCKNTIGMANINAKQFQSIQLPIPPTELQLQFKKKVHAIRNHKLKLQKQFEQCNALFKALQQKAFSESF